MKAVFGPGENTWCGEGLVSYFSLLSSLVEWRVLAVPWLAAVPTVRRDVGRGAE